MKKLLSSIIVAIVCLAVGFGSGYEYMAYKVKSALAQAIKPLAQMSSRVTGTTDSETPTPATAMQAAKDQGMKTIDKKIGDEIVLDTGKVMVNSVSETQTLSSSFSNPAVSSHDRIKSLAILSTE